MDQEIDSKLEFFKSHLNFQHQSVVNHIIYNPPTEGSKMESKMNYFYENPATGSPHAHERFKNLRMSLLELSVDEQHLKEQTGIWTHRANSNMPGNNSIHSTFKVNKP